MTGLFLTCSPEYFREWKRQPIVEITDSGTGAQSDVSNISYVSRVGKGRLRVSGQHRNGATFTDSLYWLPINHSEVLKVHRIGIAQAGPAKQEIVVYYSIWSSSGIW